jgi:hypothetical protein
MEFSPSRTSLPTDTASERWPISKIRTETVLSRLPIHNLAKRGQVNIQIVKKNPEGEVTLKWEVSHSDRYGQPRQIAYKLDTIVINRRIDEAGRPLPRMICLGSLRDIAEELELGGDTNKIRRALRQNAFAAITAKMTYPTAHGTQKRLEADFTRYGVVLTGEKLPDGRRADAVYVILNEPYREVLNNAPLRPLNYAYLKALPPAAQRFYEVLSYRVYAALASRRPEARISYSDYCAFSAQQRYFDYNHFKKQMYKIHRLHVQSGYLKTVSYAATTDDEGKTDWMMSYVPGPRAEAEFKTFSARGQHAKTVARPSDLESALGEWSVKNEIHPRRHGAAARATTNQEATELVRHFHRLARGVDHYELPAGSREVIQADELLRLYGQETARFVIALAVKQAQKTNFGMRTFGAIMQYIPEGVAAFELHRKRVAAKTNRDQTKAAERARAEIEYEKGREKLRALSPAARDALYKEVKAAILARSSWVKDPDHSPLLGRFLQRMIEAGMIDRLNGESKNSPPAGEAVA